MISRTTKVVSSFDDPRMLNGIYRAVRLPQSFHEPEPKPEPLPPSQPSKAEIDAAVDKRIAELLGAKKVNNDPNEALQIAVRAQLVQEQRAITAESKVAELQAKVPDEATTAELAKWRELGESPDKVKAAIDAGSEAIKTATDLKRKDVLADVREVLKVKKSPLFDTLTNGVEFKVAGEIKDGKDERAVLIVSDGKETPWDEFLKGRLDITEALPALKAEPEKTGTRWDKAPSGPQDKGQNPDLLKQGQQASYSTTQSAF
jgi:hypothetical protein